MTEAALRKLLLVWPGVTVDVKWGADLVFSVGGKMFAVFALEGDPPGRMSLKVEADRFLEMTERPGFLPAPYLARAHWVLLTEPKSLPLRELKELLRQSYELVRARLPRKTQRELEAFGDLQ
jgi:predicted DNA-binding protein (MmcQ/YjbR family)